MSATSYQPWSPPPIEESPSRAHSVKSWTGSEAVSETPSRTSRQNGSGHSHSLPPTLSQREAFRESYGAGARLSEASRGPLRDYPIATNTDDFLNENMLGDGDEDNTFASSKQSYGSPNHHRVPSQPWNPPPPPPVTSEHAQSTHHFEPAPQRGNISMQGRRLVIGIDYGTTYTGIAFATPNGDVALLNEIDVIKNWGFGMNNDEKIPSVVSYSPTSRHNEQQFGSNLSENAVAMVNTKLELDVQDSKLAELESLIHALEGMKNLSYSNVRACKGSPGFSWKSPEAIVTDYLTKVFKAFEMYLGKTLPPGLQEITPVDIVITVPVMWSYKARNSTYRAIRNAGFNENKFMKLDNVTMVKEPEAASLYAVRYLREENPDFLKPGDSFVLCDAGGGTVDVISYRVVRIEPRLELKQIGMPTCRKCGSIYIDANFKEWLRDVVGPRHWRELDPKSVKGRVNALTTEGKLMRDIMKQFDGDKKLFGLANRDIQIRLDGPLRDANVRNTIRDGLLTIPRETMKSFFDPCVDSTVELILGQINQAEMEGRRVKNIIMIGGFAESPYLQAEIQKSLGLRSITLQRPNTSWTAVVRGAVISGIENAENVTRLKACPKNYGICLTEDFSGIRDNWDDRYTDNPTGRMMATGQMHWLIMKGDLLVASEARVASKECPFTFSETDSRKWKFHVYEYADDDVPQRYQNAADELTTVFSIDVDLSSVPLEHMQRSHNNGKPYYTASTTCKLTYTSTNHLEAHMVFDGKTVGSARKDMRGTNGFREY